MSEKNEKLMGAISGIGDDLVEEMAEDIAAVKKAAETESSHEGAGRIIKADLTRTNDAPQKKRRTPLRRRIAALAAAAAVLLGAVLLPGVFQKGGVLPGQTDGPKGAEKGVVTVLAEAAYPELEVHNFESLDLYQEAVAAFMQRAIPEIAKAGDEGQNLAFSPLNIYMALSMLSETVGGDTQKEILDLLGAKNMELQRRMAAAAWKNNYFNGDHGKLLLANSMWLREGFPFKKAAIETLAREHFASSFSGQPGTAEFDKALQDWINKQTDNMVKDSVDTLKMDPATIMALVSTIRFSGIWSDEFMDKFNTEDTFHAKAGDVTATFMHQTHADTVFYGEKYSAASKDFNSGYIMDFILPDEGVDPAELLSDPDVLKFLTESWAERYERTQQKRALVNLSVPKFDISSDLHLEKALQSLGITSAFSADKGDFSPLTDEGGIFLSSVQHGARILIDEKGCEAAAYTAMMVCGAAMPPTDIIDFTLDRPFVFAVRGGDGVPVFVGIVETPAK
ncbi:MAG: hypothetical protein IJL66_04345 [Lachnospiraceae bacterium]|nr:hypothetical protein [Lachnospiraceae bacterium]